MGQISIDTSDIVRRHWVWAAQEQHAPEVINAHWAALTTEPAGVDHREVDLDGTPALWVEPVDADPDAVLFFIHGGGFVSGTPSTHRKLAGHLAKATGARALVVGYRHSPQHVYPAQLDDVTRGYAWALAQGVDPARTAVAGDSCGAWLSLSLIGRAKQLGLTSPAALLLISPWVDLTQSGASYTTNAATDPFFAKPLVDLLAAMNLGETSGKDPAVDLSQADYRGMPPMYIQVGGDEVLLDDARMLNDLARAADVESRLDVFPGQLHTFQMAAGNLAVADTAIDALAAWLRPKLDLR